MNELSYFRPFPTYLIQSKMTWARCNTRGRRLHLCTVVLSKVNQSVSRLWTVVQFSGVLRLSMCTQHARIYIKKLLIQYRLYKSKQKKGVHCTAAISCWFCTSKHIDCLQVAYDLNRYLKPNGNKNLRSNQKQNSHNVLRKKSISCNLCQLTKGICRESLCPIQTLPKLFQIKDQNRNLSFSKIVKEFQQTSEQN
jgi:hypothetical protein